MAKSIETNRIPEYYARRLNWYDKQMLKAENFEGFNKIYQGCLKWKREFEKYVNEIGMDKTFLNSSRVKQLEQKIEEDYTGLPLNINLQLA